MIQIVVNAFDESGHLAEIARLDPPTSPNLFNFRLQYPEHYVFDLHISDTMIHVYLKLKKVAF